MVCFTTTACETKKSYTETVTAIKKIKIKPIVASPFTGVNVSYNKFTIESNTDATITTASGSKIYVSSASLTDTAGKPINEPVELSYREFMNPAEIMASGIPMTFTDKQAGIKKPFQSAGMFELLAETKSGKKVNINPKYPVRVDLASNNNGNDYSNFYLNKTTGEWVYSGEEKKAENLKKTSLNKQLKKLKEITPFLEKDFFVLDGFSLLDEYLNNDYDKISPFIKNRKKTFPDNIVKYGIKSAEVYSYNMVRINRLEIAPELVVWENVNHVEFPGWTETKRAEINNIEGNMYEISVNDGKKKPTIFKIRVRAIMTIKSLFKFSPDMWSKKYDETLKEIKEQENTLATLRDVYRTLEVNSFGIYNCDRFYNQPEVFNVKAKFILPKSEKGFIPDKIYYVSLRDKICIEYSLNDTVNLKLVPDPTVKLYTVLENNMLAVIENDALSQFKKEKDEDKLITLHFVSKAKINSTDDLKKCMGI